MMAASKTEDYQLLGEVLDQGLKELGYSREDLSVEPVRQRQAACTGPILQQGEELQLQILLALFRDGLREPQIQ